MKNLSNISMFVPVLLTLLGLNNNVFAYAVIAFDPDGPSFGYAYNYENTDLGPREAEIAALFECDMLRKGSRNCEIAVTFSNTCATLAYSSNTNVFGWAVGDYHEPYDAIRACDDVGCEVKATVCDN